jgi:hypothetical protein
MNLQQGSKGEKCTSFARAPNVYGFIVVATRKSKVLGFLIMSKLLP